MVVGDFGDLGDIGKSDKNYLTKVTAVMDVEAVDHAIDFMLSTGDNIYPLGIETSGDWDQANAIMNEFQTPNLKDLPMYLSLGNHDCYSDTMNEVLYSKVNPQWRMPSKFYDLEVPLEDEKMLKMGILVLNACELACGKLDSGWNKEECEATSQIIDSEGFKEQLAWVESKLKEYQARSDIVWTTLLMHNPILMEPSLKKYLLPIARKYKVDIALVGHKHMSQYMNLPKDYEIEFPEEEFTGKTLLDCNKKKTKEYLPQNERALEYKQGDHLHQVHIGSSGTKLKKICPVMEQEGDIYFQNAEYHAYVSITAMEDHVKIKWRNIHEKEIFSVKITRQQLIMIVGFLILLLFMSHCQALKFFIVGDFGDPGDIGKADNNYI